MMSEIINVVWLLLLLLSRELWCKIDRPSDDESDLELEDASLPPPTNISVDSFNFRTTVQWEWDSSKISGTPNFTVFIKSIEFALWEEIPSCINISKYHCDVSEFVDDVEDTYFFGIKTEIDSKMSKLAEYSEFYLPKEGKIGPSVLNATINGSNVTFVIYHPLSPLFVENQQLSVNDLIGDYNYILFFVENGSWPEEFRVKNCDNQSCSISKIVSKIGANYCVSAQGWSDLYGIKGMKSEELCFYVPPFEDKPKSDPSVQIAILFIAAIVATIVCLGTVIGIYKLLQEKHVQLPKSLANVMRTLSPYQVNGQSSDDPLASMMVEPCSDRFDECIPFCEGESPDTETEGSEVMKSITPVETSITTDTSCNSKQKYDINWEPSSIELGHSNSEISPVEISGNGNTQLNINEPCTPVMSSGYDRAHVPVQLLIETCATDTVIGYQATKSNTNQNCASAES